MGLEKDRKPSAVYFLLLALYIISTFLLMKFGKTGGTVDLFGYTFPMSLLTGVLSSFANMCLIVMVVYAGKQGFITALVLLILQFPLNLMGMFTRHDIATLPGIFNSVLVIAVITLIYHQNGQISRYQTVELVYAKARQKGAERLFEQTATSLVNAIDAKDEYSRGHSQRVAEYSQRIAEMLGKSPEECREIYYAALLHDVGKIGINDSILTKEGKLTEEEYEAIKRHSELGRQILSGIREYPYLSIGANNHHERYDGKGYPDRLKGNDIPEIARIISVADAYDAMTSNRSYREAMPQQIVREEIVKGTGTQFDPDIAKIMQHLIDLDSEYQMKERAEIRELAGKNELKCTLYREEISEGILIEGCITKIHLRSVPEDGVKKGKNIPTMILFDSLDGRVHDEERTIKDLNYFEYAEICFNGNVFTTEARKAEMNIIPADGKGKVRNSKEEGEEYTVEAVRVKDHLSVKINDGARIIDVTIALPDSTRYAYIALTGESCHIKDVSIINTGEAVGEGYIPRIAPLISFIDGKEGDIPNVQVDGYRYDTSRSIPVTDGLKIRFHTKSLPTARLVWHCPFIVVFYSEDGNVNGEGYEEYALIRLDGENWESPHDDVKNELTVERTQEFLGWDEWKKYNKEGYDCQVLFKRTEDRIVITTENQGIFIRNIIHIGSDRKVFTSLTGDQCALTDIRISGK